MLSRHKTYSVKQQYTIIRKWKDKDEINCWHGRKCDLNDNTCLYSLQCQMTNALCWTIDVACRHMYSCMHNSLKIVNYIGSACRALFILLSLFRPSASSLLLPVMSATSLKLRPAIVLFGDSITQQGFGLNGHVGWASLLANDYIRRADVLNRGFSGYNACTNGWI